jgi:hypothetical protein
MSDALAPGQGLAASRNPTGHHRCTFMRSYTLLMAIFRILSTMDVDGAGEWAAPVPAQDAPLREVVAVKSPFSLEQPGM